MVTLRCCCFFFLMIRRPPRSTLDRSSAASDVYKRQTYIGLKNTLSAFAYCIAALIGSLRDIYGARSIFYVTGVIAIAALFLLYFLPEPRAKLMIKVYE